MEVGRCGGGTQTNDMTYHLGNACGVRQACAGRAPSSPLPDQTHWHPCPLRPAPCALPPARLSALHLLSSAPVI